MYSAPWRLTLALSEALLHNVYICALCYHCSCHIPILSDLKTFGHISFQILELFVIGLSGSGAVLTPTCSFATPLCGLSYRGAFSGMYCKWMFPRIRNQSSSNNTIWQIHTLTSVLALLLKSSPWLKLSYSISIIPSWLRVSILGRTSSSMSFSILQSCQSV